MFTQDIKNPQRPHAFFPNYLMICARPPPLPQLPLIACFDLLSFVTQLTLWTPQSSDQPSFCTGKIFLWFAFPRSCWLISHIGILLSGGERWKGFQFGCGHVYICACEHMQNGQTTAVVEGGWKAHTHCSELEFWRKLKYEDGMAPFGPTSQPQWI